MKKLMIAFAIVCAAVIAQAATVSWGSGKLYTVASAEGGFSSTAARATVSAYLFTLTADQYNSFLASYNNDGNMSGQTGHINLRILYKLLSDCAVKISNF